MSGDAMPERSIIGAGDRVLVTGATGFLGARVVASLVEHGLRDIRCFTRPSSDATTLQQTADRHPAARVEVVQGDLLSRDDCERAMKDVAVVYHLAAGTGTKSFPDAFMHSVVTTRNLLEAALRHGSLRRFVSISSFAVYSNRDRGRSGVLDESSAVEEHPACRGEAYAYAKAKQDELVVEYGHKHAIPYVIVRPGVVYGPGTRGLSGRVGTGAFGVFLHLGGANVVPLTYVDNCADAVVLAGNVRGIDGEVVNVVDDDLPTSRQLLKLYKEQVDSFFSVPVPRPLSFLLCTAWEKYSAWSDGQLPPVFNRSAWHAYWKGSRYSNGKAKRLLGWSPRVSTTDGLRRYFESCRERARDAA